MKKLIFTPVVLLCLIGCEKVNTIEGLSDPNYYNRAPVVSAGDDFYTALPADSAALGGTAKDANADIISSVWKKISGPASYLIEQPTSLKTKIHNLVAGTYEFELTATDQGGLSGLDTVMVEVRDSITGANELVFSNLTWIFPWYSAIEVKNIIQLRSPTKVFIKRDFESIWHEVKSVSNTYTNDPYEYFIERRQDGAGMYNYGSLYIFYYGTNTDDTPNVKVQF